MVKNLPAMQETKVLSLGWGYPLEKVLATYSSILAWRILRTEEPGGLQSMGSERARHNWATNTHTHNLILVLILLLSCHFHLHEIHMCVCVCICHLTISLFVYTSALMWVSYRQHIDRFYFSFSNQLCYVFDWSI